MQLFLSYEIMKKEINVIRVKGNTYCFDTLKCLVPYYRIDDRRIIMLDSGVRYDREALVEEIEKQSLMPVAILTSHAHSDHVGNHVALREKYGTKIYLDSFSAATLQDHLSRNACYYARTYHSIDKLDPLCIEDPDYIFRRNQSEITIEGASFRVVHLPGHAHDLCAFVTPDRVCYLSDALESEELFRKHPFLFHVGTEEAINSLNAISAMDYPAYVIAHKGVYDTVKDVAAKQIEHYNHIGNCICFTCGEWSEKEEIITRVLKYFHVKPQNEHSFFVAETCISSIINYLVDSGRLINRFAEYKRLYKTVKN